MFEHTNILTIEEFVDKEIRVWGFEEVERLFNAGYEVVRTDDGKWSWRASADVAVRPRLTTSR